MPVFDEKCIKANIREFNGVIKKTFQVTKCQMSYACIACITIDFVMKMKKRIIHKFI